MVETKYKNIPALSKWQSDSSVTFAARKDDRILAQIDFLVERYHHHLREGNGTMQTTIVSDLFFTLNTWVKLYHQKHPNVKAARYPAIMALFTCVVLRRIGAEDVPALPQGRPGLSIPVVETEDLRSPATGRTDAAHATGTGELGARLPAGHDAE